MTETPQLLRAYAGQNSESAFRELVTRYIDLVYSTAIRQVNGDSHFAEDVTQMVFSDFARKAASLPENVMLGGWLHRHTCFVAANALRSERRRQAREQQAVEMNALTDDSDAAWRKLSPESESLLKRQKLNREGECATLLRFESRLPHSLSLPHVQSRQCKQGADRLFRQASPESYRSVCDTLVSPRRWFSHDECVSPQSPMQAGAQLENTVRSPLFLRFRLQLQHSSSTLCTDTTVGSTGDQKEI